MIDQYFTFNYLRDKGTRDKGTVLSSPSPRLPENRPLVSLIQTLDDFIRDYGIEWSEIK